MIKSFCSNVLLQTHMTPEVKQQFCLQWSHHHAQWRCTMCDNQATEGLISQFSLEHVHAQ